MANAKLPGLRKRLPKDYKELTDVKILKAKRLKCDGASSGSLYPIEIVEEENNRYKVHYVGYANTYDEWKTCEELVTLSDSSKSSTSDTSNSIIEQFSL